MSLIFSTIRTGCTWRLVKGLTYDALPCRSVECGSSTAAATPLYEDKGTLFFFLPFFCFPFFFSFFFFVPSYSARGKPVLFHAFTKSSQRRRSSRTTVSRRYRTVISNANSPSCYICGRLLHPPGAPSPLMGRITVDGKWKTNIEQLEMAWNRDPCLRSTKVNYFIIPFRSAICFFVPRFQIFRNFSRGKEHHTNMLARYFDIENRNF